MDFECFRTKYLEQLIQGNRMGCRQVIGEALQTGTPANSIYTELFWPVMNEIEQLYRGHRIDRITENMSTRINRTLVDQLQSKLPHAPKRDLKMVITCADDEAEELGAQMCADLLESDGWEVKFIGKGVPNDELISLIGFYQPDILFRYGSKPSDAPNVRKIIDTLRGIQACPNIRIMLSGGVFNRAEGLWEEIGADMFASTAKEALKVVLSNDRADTTKRRMRRSNRKKQIKEQTLAPVSQLTPAS